MKKPLLMSLCIVLCACFAIGGSLAYLTDTDSDVNVMTLGSVEIDQIEYERRNDASMDLSDGNLQEFISGHPHDLYPAIGDWTEKSASWFDGTELNLLTNNTVVDKFVTVKNTGKSSAYVRTVFAVENPADDALCAPELIWNTTGWTEAEKVFDDVNLVIDGDTQGNFDIYVAYYQNAETGDQLEKGVQTPPSLLQVALSKKAGNKDVESYGEHFDLVVISQAVQTAGFATAEEALNAGFGAMSDETTVLGWFGETKHSSTTEVDSTDAFVNALEKATADKPVVITLTDDIEYVTDDHHGENDITKASQIIIDGQGKYKITFIGQGVTPFGDDKASLLLKNLKVFDNSVSYDEQAWELSYLEMGSRDLRCENVDFADPISVDSDNAVFVNCSFVGHDDKNSGATQYGVWVTNGNAEFINCTFSGTRGLKICDKYAPEVGTVVIDGCTFDSLSEKPGIAIDDQDTQDMNIIIKNSKFINCQAGEQGNYIFETDNTMPKYDENNTVLSVETITVASVDEFKRVLTESTDANSKSVIIKLEKDLNFASENWTPITVDGYHGAEIVTIDGNNKTITNLNAPLFAGGFAGKSGIVIKNLTIADSEIVSSSTQGSGAFIECVDSMPTIELNNCHLVNSTMTGSRTGGLVGWTAGYNNVNDGPVKTYVTVKECSVIDCDINGTGSVGAIFGHAGGNAWTFSTVSNCRVENCTLNSTDTGSWRVGVVVGTANVGDLTISGITESDNTLTQTGKTAPTDTVLKLYGRFVPGETGKLTINGQSISNN